MKTENGKRKTVGRYLITGVAGSGKSTIAYELSRRGYAAYDTDAGFSYYANKQTGQKVTRPLHPTLEWYDKHERVFDEKVLQNLFKKHQDEDLLICSITANQKKYYPQFDKIFLLTADDELLAHRLQTRTTSHFGKHPVDFHRVFAGKQAWENEVRAAGAFEIDSSKPIKKVVDQILKQLK
ncbi:hypothetical protein A3F65_00420 [Candidatus Saccharibacteria bacterium RIFCSPHIGHO2_12_FULL_47_16b]|nr:MAG: hypothetical protein A3F65_00420 [Candidatus Saccharibacteria bacterium RIFCSPHIGHO2_12_FULL_47_16b]OGL38383.1 MAG: hypothetical protein A3J32_03445 [Candidatus Saccharibacteria bacterium RIFCSPLOWO2_02_FULL_46_7]